MYHTYPLCRVLSHTLSPITLAYASKLLKKFFASPSEAHLLLLHLSGLHHPGFAERSFNSLTPSSSVYKNVSIIVFHCQQYSLYLDNLPIFLYFYLDLIFNFYYSISFLSYFLSWVITTKVVLNFLFISLITLYMIPVDSESRFPIYSARRTIYSNHNT